MVPGVLESKRILKHLLNWREKDRGWKFLSHHLVIQSDKRVNESKRFTNVSRKMSLPAFLLVASIMEINWNVKFEQVRQAKQSKTTRT